MQKGEALKFRKRKGLNIKEALSFEALFFPSLLFIINTRSFIMSSPTRRVLSPSKNHNISRTPLKLKKNSPFNTSSPIKIPKLNNSNILTPVKKNPAKKPRLGFTIFEDKPKPASAYSNTAKSPSPSKSNKTDHNDQENILQPKPLNLKQQSFPKRVPLKPLSTNEFPGFLKTIESDPALSRSIQLTEPYVPQNYKSTTSTNLHHFNSLPSFVTPPRKNLVHNDKFLFKSEFLDDKENDDDLLERHLIAKHKNLVRRHKRAMSVGKNDAKAPLVKKNTFSILSN